MVPIQNLEGVQRLVMCVAALSWFLSRLGEKGCPLQALEEKTATTTKAQEALDRIKVFLTSPVLVAPDTSETLLLYVTSTS
jgi:hypothetical protein